MLTILIMAMVKLSSYLSLVSIYIYIYILHTSKLICITMPLWIFLSLVQGGVVNLKIYLGKSENELLVLNTLVFPYIFLLFDCFEWVLIDRIVKCKVHSVLWQIQGGGVHLKLYLGKSENELLVLNTLVFPYIFLLFDCFEWVLIDRIVKCKVHSVLWQFQAGRGVHLKIYLGKSENELLVLNTLVFPYIFLLFDCFEWVLIDSIVKCKVHLVLCQFPGGWVGKSENELLDLNTLVFPYIFLLFDCFEWELIDRIVKCKVHSVLWQFQGGVNLTIYPLVFPYIFLLFFILVHCHFSMH